MKRSGPRGEDAGVQLFPFLAVLICTMGAMVLVLVLLSHRAKQAAAAAATAIAQANKAQQAAAGPNADEAKEAAEVRRSELEWRIEQMRTIREKTAEALADKRLELANLEQHARQLRSELTQLKQTAETVEPAGVPGGSVRGELEENLRQLQGALVQKRVELADAVHARNGRPRGYAIVPYVGPNGTRRRPIYLECLIDRIVFQPEGIELTEEDFQGPIGPQNPLAAGVRAAVDYLSQSTTAGAESGEPYPLLIVRPDGIGAYYAARRALTSWTTDFGYELVENDWKLEYPPADPALAKNVTLAVVDGQQRQRLLAQVMPR